MEEKRGEIFAPFRERTLDTNLIRRNFDCVFREKEQFKRSFISEESLLFYYKTRRKERNVDRKVKKENIKNTRLKKRKENKDCDLLFI